LTSAAVSAVAAEQSMKVKAKVLVKMLVKERVRVVMAAAEVM